MNTRRGLMRLAIAIGVPWFGWWGLVGLMNFLAYQRADAEWWKAERAENWSTAAVHSKAQVNAMEWMELAVVWGVIVPVGLLIIGGIGFWIYRGFKPKT